MALSTESYSADGLQKEFTVANTVLSESHVRVHYYYDSIDHSVSSDYWDLLGSTILFATAPTAGHVVKITVSSDGTGLDDSPTNISTIANNIDDVVLAGQSAVAIVTVADNILDVNTNATNIVAIQNASANADTATAKAQEASDSASTALELKNTVVEKEALVNPHYGAIDSIAAVEVLEDMNILANTQTLADIEAVAGIADLIEEGVGSIGNTTSQGMFQHNKRIVSDKTITEDYNAISAGPVTVDEGVTVTVPEGSTWTVV
jgi:hypothetical protein